MKYLYTTVLILLAGNLAFGSEAPPGTLTVPEGKSVMVVAEDVYRTERFQNLAGGIMLDIYPKMSDFVRAVCLESELMPVACNTPLPNTRNVPFPEQTRLAVLQAQRLQSRIEGLELALAQSSDTLEGLHEENVALENELQNARGENERIVQMGQTPRRVSREPEVLSLIDALRVVNET